MILPIISLGREKKKNSQTIFKSKFWTEEASDSGYMCADWRLANSGIFFSQFERTFLFKRKHHLDCV